MSSVLYSAVLILFLQAGNIAGSVRWPSGYYGLLKPRTGCPDGWYTNEWIHEESLMGSSARNSRSDALNITGVVNSTSVKRYFCIKRSSSPTNAPTWPKGKYCIYSKWRQRTTTGYIIKIYKTRKYNYVVSNKYGSVYYLYHAIHDSQDAFFIEIYFACQTSGNRKIPIELPISKPFYLLPYGSSECQQVKWMVATTEWIKYHTQNSVQGDHYSKLPYYDYSNNKGLKMYYCYYRGCNYTLNKANGVFNSPGFPKKYPDGQLCSWRIVVPVNHVVHVSITNLSLYEYDKDCLQLYEKIDGIFKPKQAFFGDQLPHKITAVHDLMFVFRSDEVNNSTGFRAEYEIFKIAGCNYTLTERKGVFPFPGKYSDGKYPDGQLCSWKIMVPANHTVNVNFTTFSLSENDEDCLQLYRNINGRFKVRQAFFGHQQPFTVTAMSDLLFVFRSEEENINIGFTAEYEVIKVPERTTTAKPSTTTTQEPTTTQPTTKIATTKQPTTQSPTNKPLTTTEGIAFLSTKTNVTTNDTVQSRRTSDNHKSSNNNHVQSLKKTCFCDETWRTVVMVIPLIGFILIVVVTIDIVCRCRYRNASKSSKSADDGIAVNPTYERGDINIAQQTDSATDDSIFNTVDDQVPSRDELPDYEDVDYTQVNDVPPPKRNTAYPESHALHPLGNNAPEAFYHVLEPPIADLDRPTYQNLSDVNHYTLNPVHDSTQNSFQHAQANEHYEQYFA